MTRQGSSSSSSPPASDSAIACPLGRLRNPSQPCAPSPTSPAIVGVIHERREAAEDRSENRCQRQQTNQRQAGDLDADFRRNIDLLATLADEDTQETSLTQDAASLASLADSQPELQQQQVDGLTQEQSTGDDPRVAGESIAPVSSASQRQSMESTLPNPQPQVVDSSLPAQPAIIEVYNTVVHWKKFFFKVPSGSAGKDFVRELSSQLQKYVDLFGKDMNALYAFFSLPSLMLLSSDRGCGNTKAAGHLHRRLDLWSRNDLEQ